MSFLRTGALAALLSLALPHSALGQGWSDEFDQPGLFGRVFGVSTWHGDLVAGGYPLSADGEYLGLAARFDGTHWQPLGGGLAGDQVRALVEYQGELVAGGLFSAAGGKAVSNIARWDGTTWDKLGGGVNGRVFALEVWQGDLYVGGEFTTAGGVQAANVARWDGSQWHAVGGGLDKSFDPQVLALLGAPDGKLYAAGEFDTAGGTSAKNVAAWDGASWKPVGGGFPGPLNGMVWDLEWYAGQLHACANFDLVAGGANHEKLARFDGTQWVAAGVFPDTAIGTTVYAIEEFAGELYAAGNFSEASGALAPKFARFDGSQWLGVGGVFGSSVQTTIFDLVVQDDRMAAGGEFSQAGPTFWPGEAITAQSIASYDRATSEWSSIGEGLGFNFRPDDVTIWNGSPVVVGGFSEAGGQVVAGPVHLVGDDWKWLGHFSGIARAATVYQGDLVVVGEFDQIDDQAIFGIARYDGSQWSGFGSGAGGRAVAVYQGQLYVGGLGGVVRWNGTSWESFASQIFGVVYDLHVHAGVLYIAGSLSGDGHLVSWDGSVQQTVGGGLNGAAYALESWNGDLWVGGVFTSAGGTATKSLASWDGTSFSPAPGGLNGPSVNCLTTFEGDLVASGTLFPNSSGAKQYIARWNGSTWSAFGGGLNGNAQRMAVDPVQGRLWAVGLFTAAAGRPAWWASFWDADPSVGVPYCAGVACPCGNDGGTGTGCANSTGIGGSLVGEGGTSVSADELVLRAAALPSNQFAVPFMGPAIVAPAAMGDGLLCTAPPLRRFPVVQADLAGALDVTGIVSWANGNFPPDSKIAPGDTWNFQLWYRDPGGPCGKTSNVTNGVSVTFTP